MAHVGAEVLADDAVPLWEEFQVEFLLDVGCDVLVYVVLLDGDARDLYHFLLLRPRHVRHLDYFFSTGDSLHRVRLLALMVYLPARLLHHQ